MLHRWAVAYARAWYLLMGVAYFFVDIVVQVLLPRHISVPSFFLLLIASSYAAFHSEAKRADRLSKRPTVTEANRRIRKVGARAESKLAEMRQRLNFAESSAEQLRAKIAEVETVSDVMKGTIVLGEDSLDALVHVPGVTPSDVTVLSVDYDGKDTIWMPPVTVKPGYGCVSFDGGKPGLAVEYSILVNKRVAEERERKTLTSLYGLLQDSRQSGRDFLRSMKTSPPGDKVHEPNYSTSICGWWDMVGRRLKGTDYESMVHGTGAHAMTCNVQEDFVKERLELLELVMSKIAARIK